jgi:hypothetical protein
MKYRLLVIYGDVDPVLQRKSYEMWGLLCEAAKRKKKTLDEEDSIFWVREGKTLQIGSFTSEEVSI